MGEQRVLVFSERALESPKWQLPNYEFEDVVAAIDDVALLAPEGVATSAAKHGARRVTRWVRELPDTRLKRLTHRAVRHVRRPQLVSAPAIRPVRVAGEFALFFAVLHFPTDVVHLLRLHGWRQRCQRAVCFIPELWTRELDASTPYLRLLERFGFDHVFVLNARLAARVGEIAQAPCSFMALGVDALAFAPYPDPPARVVDFFQFGRRSPVTHDAVLELARRDGRFYLYDTIFHVPVPDHAAHRELLRSILQRTRFTFSYRLGDDHYRAGGEDVLAARFFEAAAAGAVVLGSEPRVPEYAGCFPWPDATIPIPYDAREIGAIVAELETAPERLERARTANVAGSLRRHDWAYRWEQVLAAAGLEPTGALAERRRRLEALGQLISTASP